MFFHRLCVLPAMLALAIAVALLVDHANAAAQATTGGDPKQGAALIHSIGCGACHVVPGVDEANGEVGPPLAGIADRTYIAGKLRNTPENMIRWLRNPQNVVRGNAMPDMGLSEESARDIAAYLYTLR
jgi:cytochrome c2